MRDEWHMADGIAISFFLFAGAACIAPLLLMVAEPSSATGAIVFGVGCVGGGVLAGYHNETRIREPIIGVILLLLYFGNLAASGREHMVTHWELPLVGLLGAVAGARSARLITKRRSSRLGLGFAIVTFVLGVAVVGLMRGVPMDGDQLNTGTPLGVAVCVAVFALAVAVTYRKGFGVGAWSLFFGAGLLSIDWLPAMLIPPALIGTSMALILSGCGFLFRARRKVKEKIPAGRVVNS